MRFALYALALCILTFTDATSGQEQLFGDSFEDAPTARGPSESGNPQIYERADAPWKIHFLPGFAWESAVARTGEHSVQMGKTDGLVAMNSRSLSVSPGDYIEAQVWGKAQDATGDVYVLLDFYGPGGALRGVRGGTPESPLGMLPGSLGGTCGWRNLLARAAAPPGSDRVVVSLVSDRNKGQVWFDDLSVRRLPSDWLRGELDRHPPQINPASLTPDDYVSIRNGHLYRAGQRIRLWSAGGNLVAATHADIDREIQRFKWHGFNMHRSHWSDDEVTDDYAPGDNSAQDLRDYMIAALGANDLFFWSFILNSCQVRPEMVSVIDDRATAQAWQDSIKALSNEHGWHPPFMTQVFDPRCKAIYHDYIRKVMAHRNKHNGLTYGEDPTIAVWELNNEQWWVMRILWGNHLQWPSFFQNELYARWNEWLVKKYRTPEALAKAWGSLLPGESLERKAILMVPLLGQTKVNEMARTLGIGVRFDKASYGPQDLPKARAADVLEFLVSIYLESCAESAAILKSQGRQGLGCQIVPLVYDTGYSGAVLPLYMQSLGDATTSACYLDMSTHDPKQKTFPFASGLTRPPLLNDWLDDRRVEAKPHFVYETMIFNPQKYRAEFAYRLAAWAAIQDVDVASFHYYGHPLVFSDLPNRYTMNPIEYMSASNHWSGVNMRSDEVLMSSIKLAGEIFKHGYLSSAKKPTVATLGRKTMFDLDGINGGEFAGRSQLTAFDRGFRWSFAPQRDGDSLRGTLVSPGGQQTIIRPTEQISYRLDEGKLVIDDNQAKALVGFGLSAWKFDDGVELESISIRWPPNMPYAIEGERYAAIGIASEDGRPLADSGRIVVSAVSTSFNSGLKIDPQKMIADASYAFGLARAISDPGGLPVLTARVGLTIRAPWLTGRRYRMIDYNENVLKQGVIGEPRLDIPSGLPVYLTEIDATTSTAPQPE